MFADLESLLINALFIIIPLFLYQIFWVDKGLLKSKWTNIIITSISALSIILCMSFPIQFYPGFYFDLRHIPFILGALYGGYRIAIPLFLTILFSRFFIGGEGVYVNFIVITLIMAIVPNFKEKYKGLNLRNKFIVLLTTSATTGIMVVILSNVISQNLFFKLDLISFHFISIQILTALLITYAIETMIQNVKLKENLVYTEKLNVISELSASISHEVRNPLTVSKGFLQILKSSDLSSEQRSYYVDISLTELERAEKIITDYLSITKMQKENLVTSNLEEDLSYIANVIKPYATMNQVEVYTHFNSNLLVTYDRNQIRQCLMNLAKNSIEAMPCGGALNIELSSSKDKAVIKIRDNGIGMTKEQISHLGTPFYTTKEKGTGLGMKVIFSTIYEMKGKIEINSREGKGTIFSIELPGHSNEIHP